MSSSTFPQSPAASNAMRQQLDELDAILQRMLTLPVNGRDEPDEKSRSESFLTPPPVRRRPVLPPPLEKPPLPETVPSPPRVEPPAKPRAPTVILQQVNSPSTLSVPEMPALKIAAPPVTGTEPSTSKSEPIPGWGPEQVETPQAPVGPDTPVAIEPIVVPKPSEFLERRLKRLAEQRRAAPWIGPLSRLTAAFDRCFVALGKPGLWLVRSDVRTVMGWLGIGMLLAAAAILVGDRFGWTW
jgi:hypothetical protein